MGAVGDASAGVRSGRVRLIETDLPGPAVEPSSIGGWVLDVSAVVAFVDATAYAQSVRALARRGGRTLLVPLPVMAAVARRHRDPHVAERLSDLLAEPAVLAVDGSVAAGPHFARLVERATGDRLAALVVMLSIERGWPVLTDRGDALCRLRPDLLVIPS